MGREASKGLTRRCLYAVIGGVLGVVACSRGGPAAQAAPASVALPASTAAAAPAPAQAKAPSAAPAGGTVIASETFSGDPTLRCDLLEVKRMSGNALRIRWRVVHTGTSTAYYAFDWNELYYVDPAENKKYGYLTDSAGEKILDVFWGNYKPGEQKTQWAKFPAPPASSTKITVNIPKFTPFEDVPVSQ